MENGDSESEASEGRQAGKPVGWRCVAAGPGHIRSG